MRRNNSKTEHRASGLIFILCESKEEEKTNKRNFSNFVVRPNPLCVYVYFIESGIKIEIESLVKNGIITEIEKGHRCIQTKSSG